MTPMAVREPDPRITAAEDAMASYRGDLAWLALHDDRWRQTAEDVCTPTTATLSHIGSTTGTPSDPTGVRGMRLYAVTERTMARQKRVEAVDAAFRLLYASGRGEDVRILRLYYFDATPVDTIAEALHWHRKTVWEHRVAALEVVADMVDGAKVTNG